MIKIPITIPTQNRHLGESQQGLKYLKLKVFLCCANYKLIKEFVPNIREINVTKAIAPARHTRSGRKTLAERNKREKERKHLPKVPC